MAAEIEAERLGRAARADLQLRVPRRPVPRPGTRLRRSGDAVVLDGADRGQVFSGAFAESALLPLVQACDGRRGHSELARLLDLDEELVYKSVALLAGVGALEEGEGGTVVDHDRSLVVALARSGSATGVNAHTGEAFERMARQTVSLVGDPALVALTRAALPSGIRLVDGAGAGEGEGEGEATEVPSLTISLGTTAHRPEAATLERRWDDGAAVLHVHVDRARVVVGPWAEKGTTPCAACGTASLPEGDGEATRVGLELAAGLVAHHVLALVARTATTHLPADSSVLDLDALTTRHVPAVTRPGCSLCSPVAGPTGPSPAGAVYEASVAIPPRAFLSPRDHQAHYWTSNIGLQSAGRTWPTQRHVALPVEDLPDALRRPPGPRASAAAPPTSVEDLALLLRAAFGTRDDDATPGRPRRWTAAAGNIGCTTAHVLVREGQALPPGTYAYVAAEHSLAVLSTDVPPGDRPLDVVVTGDLRKIMTKYGTFGLRLAFLDAGCALTVLRQVGDRLGVAVAPLAEWSAPDLGTALETGPDDPVVAVATIGGA